MKIKKEDFLRRNATDNYTDEIIKERLKDLELKTGQTFEHTKHYSLNPENLKGNIENFIGVTQVPLGVAGPLLVNGDYAKGLYYVPMATTEGSLIDSFTRAMVVASLAGGVKTKILQDVMHVTPAFSCSSIEKAIELETWIKNNYEAIKERAEKSTSHGKLIGIKTKIFTRRVFVKFEFTTGDAMGLNMVTISTYHACKFISANFGDIKFFLRSNMSSDKKASITNAIYGYGKTVYAELKLTDSTLKRFFRTDAKSMMEGWKIANYAQMQGATMALNQHFANGLAAMFIATGQDVAQIVNGAAGWITPEITDDDGFYGSLTIPNLLIGTVGGGTRVESQKEALEMMGCYGADKSKKLAEIMVATIMAGELSLAGAMVHGDFILAHKQKNIEIKKKLDI